jgi:hypothetical protein
VAKQRHFEHKDLKEPDAFFEGFGRTRRWIEGNTRTVAGIIAGAGFVFVASVSWSAYSEKQANSTAAAFLRATDAMDIDSPETAKAALATVSKRSGSTYGHLAALYQADLSARQGDCASAIEGYRNVQNTARLGFIKQVAAMGAAFCLEETDKPADAAGAYAQAADMEGPYREQALRGQLRAATDAKDQTLAAVAIELILAEFPETPDADELSHKLAAFKG